MAQLEENPPPPVVESTVVTNPGQDSKSPEENDLLGLNVHTSPDGKRIRITITSPEFETKSQDSDVVTLLSPTDLTNSTDPTDPTPSSNTSTNPPNDLNDAPANAANDPPSTDPVDDDTSNPKAKGKKHRKKIVKKPPPATNAQVDDSKQPDLLLTTSTSPLPDPPNGSLIGSVICCVVDVSGSMNSDATIKDSMGNSESHGLTILDLVKHSIKTIIHCLTDKDRLSLVSYSNSATVVLPLTNMTLNGRKLALNRLDTLNASGGTNLWGGLEAGLNELHSIANIAVLNSSVMLFTDGKPNIRPGKGELGSLEDYQKQKCLYNTLPGIVNTYGFGYSLDSQLLDDMARQGGGNYYFIPDSSFVGTIFVNSISNFVSNIARNVKLYLNINGLGVEYKILGGFNNNENNGKIIIDLGSISYGQNKTVVVDIGSQDDDNKEAQGDNDDVVANDAEGGNEGEAEGDGNGGNSNNGTASKIDIGAVLDKDGLKYVSLTHQKRIEMVNSINMSDDNKLSKINGYRLEACDMIRECLESMPLDQEDAQAGLKKVIKSMSKDNVVKNDVFIKDLLKDLKGQVYEAIETKDAYSKWGKHYLPSLCNAHLHQYNNNFKDPGVQHYGGKLFQATKDVADKIFVALPAPTPSKLTHGAYRSNGTIAKKSMKKKKKGKKGGSMATFKSVGKSMANSAAPKINMSAYYNARGGCIEGNCNVKMYDNTIKLIKDLRKGDKLYNGSEILCVMRMKCKYNKIGFCNIGKLKITPYHPIKLRNEWIFPINIDNIKYKIEECEYVYNFLMKNGYSMIVEDIECVGMGHELIDNNVVKHEYFGNKKRIIQDLKKITGWKNGYVNLESNSFIRNENNLVIAIE